MNYGLFKGDTYTKKVAFSKAVLWHTRQLSLRVSIINRIKSTGIKKIVFEDLGKRERWIFDPEKVFASMELKSGGQEDQFYFPIDLAKKKKITKRSKPTEGPRPEYVLDEARQVYVIRYPTPEPDEPVQLQLL